MTLPVPESSDPARSRRTLLAAAAGGLLAALAGALGRPAPAGASHLQGFGHPNNVGTANTTVTTDSTATGTALLVTQNGSGTALRGSAVGPGSIAGFFTAQNGTGISGVTGNGGSYGVFGQNNGPHGTAGAMRAAGGQNHGLVATTTSSDANAVRGINTGVAGEGVKAAGVYGEGEYGVQGVSSAGKGVIGQSTSHHGVYGGSSISVGVFGVSSSGTAVEGNSASGIGVRAISGGDDSILGLSGVAFKAAVAGSNSNADGWAGYFEGNVIVTGTFNGTGSLSRIDHPNDPANQTLTHAFVGSPEMLNIYRGTATLDQRGRATVSLPGYFEALNTNVHYQLTPIGAAAPDLHVAAEVQKGQFRIVGGPAGGKVCWLVTGVRRDAYATANPIKVEAAKPAARRGRYLNPLVHGQPESKGWKDLSAQAPLPKLPAPIHTESQPAP
jgi:hypothetical protein